MSEETIAARVITYRGSWDDTAVVIVQRLEEDFSGHWLFEIKVLVKARYGYGPQNWEITWVGSEKDIKSELTTVATTGRLLNRSVNFIP